jgi:hypothetical protein
LKNFIIGQYGHFNDEKFKKDYRKGIYGIEACLLNSEDDIDSLIKAYKNSTSLEC